MKQPAILGLALFGVAACQDATSPPTVATFPSTLNAAQGAAANDYIVTFHADETDPDGRARALVAAHGGSLRHVYRAALKGFAVAGLPDAAVEALQRNPRVAAIEVDGVVSIVGAGQQTNATWGLDRIDQRQRPLDGVYNYDADGAGVTAYIIDTGIRLAHVEFGGRAASGYTAINDGNGTNDCHGHGTHVAGTVGGSTYGVAQGVTLVAVRVLNCSGSGSNSGVIAGMDWVTANRAPNSVANMSLGGSFSSAINTALANSVAAGVTYAVAAGNSNANACNYSPASAASAITVGSTTSSDAKSSFSNYGTCVDIHAPGSSITSAYSSSNTAIATMSGTSMASPHVAGAAAVYLSANPGATPSAVTNALVTMATTGLIGELPSGTVNRLLYTRLGSTPDPDLDPDPAPVAQIVKSCANFTCTFTAGSTANITDYAWDFGGGVTATGPGPHEKTYGPRQSATIRLTVTGPGGSSSTQTTVSCNPRKCQ